MIRTTLSSLVLFTGLLCVSCLLHEGNAIEVSSPIATHLTRLSDPPKSTGDPPASAEEARARVPGETLNDYISSGRRSTRRTPAVAPQKPGPVAAPQKLGTAEETDCGDEPTVVDPELATIPEENLEASADRGTKVSQGGEGGEAASESEESTQEKVTGEELGTTEESLEGTASQQPVVTAAPATVSSETDSPAKESVSDHEPSAVGGENAKGKPAQRLELRNSPSSPEVTPLTLTPEMEALRGRVRSCLATYYSRPESTNDYSPWGVMHALIAFGVDTQIVANGRKQNAIGYLCFNGNCRGMRLMSAPRGSLDLAIGVGVQGHPGQFLAMLAQSKVKRDYPIRVDGYEFTVDDLIKYEMETCRTGTELTFKLIALSHYLDTDATWKARDGQTWNLPRLIKEEIESPVIGAACGGTHRLTGYAYAVRKRERKGEPMDGQWLRARKYLDAYHEYTFSLQNADGSFSTDWFRGRGDWGDVERRLETTGHILEWLVVSLPQDQLTDPRVVRATSFLADLMASRPQGNWEIGPKGHALHALALYDERVFGLNPGNRAEAYVAALAKQRPRR